MSLQWLTNKLYSFCMMLDIVGMSMGAKVHWSSGKPEYLKKTHVYEWETTMSSRIQPVPLVILRIGREASVSSTTLPRHHNAILLNSLIGLFDFINILYIAYCKNPHKHRYMHIAGSGKCSTKPLILLLTKF